MPTNKQRREAARRHLERQLQRRAEREAARKRFTMIASIVGTIVVIAVVVVFIVAVGNDGKKSTPQAEGSNPPGGQQTSAPATPTGSSAAPAAKGECTFTPDGEPAKAATPPPNGKAPTTGTVSVAVKTTQGDMTFQLDRSNAPCAVQSFLSLVKQKFYDNTPCPRVSDSGLFMLQCGDPSGTMSGGPGYKFADELSGSEKYTAGVLAMANSGPNTNGSQFFIVYKDSQLNPAYTVFGKVTAGLDVVQKVGAAGSDNSSPAGGGKPNLPITISSMTVGS